MALDLRSLAYNYTKINEIICNMHLKRSPVCSCTFLISLQYALLIKTSRYLMRRRMHDHYLLYHIQSFSLLYTDSWSMNGTGRIICSVWSRTGLRGPSGRKLSGWVSGSTSIAYWSPETCHGKNLTRTSSWKPASSSTLNLARA